MLKNRLNHAGYIKYISRMASRNKSTSHNIPGDVLDHIEDNYSTGEHEPIGLVLRRAFGLIDPRLRAVSAFNHKARKPLLSDVSDLEIGEQRIMSRRTKKNGAWSYNQRAVSVAIEKYERESGKKFTCCANDDHITVGRIR